MNHEERRYSREEVALVLQRVAQRTPTPAGEGLTRAELQEAVREVGLDVAQLDGALAELETQHKADARLLGLQEYVVLRRVVAGQLDAKALQRANTILNRSVGIIGESERGEQGLSWFGRHVSVTISQADEHIAIHVEERFHNTTRTQLGAGAIFSLMGGAMTLVAAANAGMEALGFVLGASVPALSYVVLRKLHEARVAATKRRLEGLSEELAGMLTLGSD
jgi:hypothetical protein